MLRLTTYFRSTAAYRVRLALNIKQLDHELVPVHLLRDGGEHKSAGYLASNPDGLIPTLETEGRVLAQSMAIIEYLEEVYPSPALLPTDPLNRAYLRALSQTISCDIHPLNNLRVLQYLSNQLNVNQDRKQEWYHHWVKSGFKGIEERLSKNPNTGKCCFGDTPSLADICLIPQVYNAERFNCPMDEFPTIARINQHCLQLDAFAKAMPHKQPDAE